MGIIWESYGNHMGIISGSFDRLKINGAWHGARHHPLIPRGMAFQVWQAPQQQLPLHLWQLLRARFQLLSKAGAGLKKEMGMGQYL